MNERQEATELLVRAVNHMRQQSQKIIELSQAVEALNVSLTELFPQFETVYERCYGDAEKRLKSLGFVVPLDLYDQIIERLRRSG